MLKYCSIGSGSSGNCHYIGYKDTNILVDAGLSGKRITTGLNDINVDMENIKGIFITHEHSDHIKGAGIMSRKYNIPIFANVKTWCAMKDKLGDIKDSNMKVFENDRSYSLGDLIIRPFSISHDASDAVGYNFYADNEKMSIATDIGMITDNIRRHLYKSKLVVLESNYDPSMLMMGSYPYALKKRVMSDTGHLSNEDAVNCVYKGIRTANGGDDVYREVTKCIWEECLRKTNYKCSEVDVLVIFFEGFVKEYVEVDVGVRKEKAGNVIKTIEMNVIRNLYCEQMYFSIYNREDVLYRETLNKKKYKKGKNIKERGGGYRKIMKNVINETMSKRNKMKKWKEFVNKVLCCFGNKKIKGDLYKEDNSSVTPNSSSVEKGSGSSQLELINVN